MSRLKFTLRHLTTLSSGRFSDRGIAEIGPGALREVEAIERRIERRVRKITSEKPAGKIALSEEVLKTFEKWRRET